MNNLKLHKIINQKLNGMKELGVDTTLKKVKIEEEKVVLI